MEEQVVEALANDTSMWELFDENVLCNLWSSQKVPFVLLFLVFHKHTFYVSFLKMQIVWL